MLRTMVNTIQILFGLSVGQVVKIPLRVFTKQKLTVWLSI